MNKQVLGRVLVSVAAGASLIWAVGAASIAKPLGGPPPTFAYGPGMSPLGHSQSAWTAKWWKWAIELPLVGHPFGNDSLHPFDVTEGQTGKVWFLCGTTDGVERTCTIPKGKYLFVAMINGEESSLEGFPDYPSQLAAAVAQADSIDPNSVYFTLDGVSLPNASNYRFLSPQISFNAPNPSILGGGGQGTAVADGYFVFLKKLPPGQHTLQFGGTIVVGGVPVFNVDETYHLTQL